MTKKSWTYKEAGVDIDAGAKEVELIKESVKETYIDGVLGDLGGFGGLFSLKQEWSDEPVLVSGTDGVGTKLRLAIDLGIHDTIGQDCVAMSVNDVLVQGAKPLFFLDYIATGKLEPKLMADIVKGVANACKESGCALLGGETAEMAGFYQEGDYDVAGFAVGIVDRKKLITGETISEGDVILGIPSTGIHSNGYSLVRKLAKENHWDLKKVYPDFDKSLGEVLLTPTRLYPKVVLPLLSHIDIKGMVHITGGGFYENIPRILPEGTAVVIDGDSWPVLPIFPFLKKEGNIDAHEMYRTFNCGIGMLLILNQEDADKAMDILSEQGEKIYRIGYVTKGKKEVTITGGLFHE
ncbi:phosphoribosylformylglycinamidine cyclo-ligase [Veillonellaceae bacterium DNF00626]|nr:phosphoribosylformylglycinamidine cyclo-ligase [Veillonellaceae bacterium DNF00626]